MYEYKARVVRVVDGDTMHLAVDLGLDVGVALSIRLSGVDTPEMGTDGGRAAKAYVEAWLAEHAEDGAVTLRTAKDRREKYGRYLGTIIASGRVLNHDLVVAEQAVPYDGGSR